MSATFEPQYHDKPLRVGKRHPARTGQDATSDASAQIVAKGGVHLQVCSPDSAPLAIRYPRRPVSFLADHEACSAKCRTAGLGLGSPIRGNTENRNTPLRTMRLTISDHFPVKGLHRLRGNSISIKETGS
jgi:hypothetical protein